MKIKFLSIIIIICVPTFCFCQNKLDFITPDLQTESFHGILYKTYYQEKNAVQIDSNGKIKILAPLDTSIHTFKLFFLNDSILFFEQLNDLSEHFFNIKSLVDSRLPACCMAAISEDKNYFATGEYEDGFSGSKVYRIYPGDSISLVAQKPYRIADPYLDDKFLATEHPWTPSGNHHIFILNPDMTIFGTLPINWRLPLKHKTLFRQDLILEEGYMTDEEAKESEKKFEEQLRESREKLKKEHPGSSFDPAPGPDGYWMIRNIKTNKKKKLGFQDFYPTISSSGRHILFYKQDGDSYDIKVVSVKELVDGL